MATDIYSEASDGIVLRLRRMFNAAHQSLSRLPNFSGPKLLPKDRVAFDTQIGMSKRDSSFKEAFSRTQKTPSDSGVITASRSLNLIATIGQDHAIRYGCSRRHAIKTAANNFRRLSEDLDILAGISTVGYRPL